MGLKVAVLFGGPGAEHEISCLSAQGVMAGLSMGGFEIHPVAVDPDLTLRHTPAAQSELSSITDKLPSTADLAGTEISQLEVDIAFPILHGIWGEDGGVQQLLTDMKLKYVGSGIAASKLAMDKWETKVKLGQIGINVVPGILVTAQNWVQFELELAKLGSNLFVKPCHGGSSVGVTHVKSKAELPIALAKVFELNDMAIIETAVEQPREVEIGVLQDATGNLIFSVCGEIKLKPDFDFYDYRAKYLADGAELIVPAVLTEVEYQQICDMAQAAFTELGCAGLARVDFLIAANGDIFLNEVNTMPGFTKISMYPKMFAATGIELTELVSTLVKQGLAK